MYINRKKITFVVVKTVKNILLVVFLVTMVYGLTGSKSIAYCCGNCHVMEKPLMKKTNCCSSEGNGSTQNHDCQENPCKVVFLQYDWSPVVQGPMITPVLPVVDLLYTVQSSLDFSFRLIDKLFVENKDSPPLGNLPREYLSFICILTI